MKLGLLASVVGHGLIVGLVLLLVVRPPIDMPPEVAVELATGSPSPPPAPEAPPPAPEPQQPTPPTPQTEPVSPQSNPEPPPPTAPAEPLLPPPALPGPVEPPPLPAPVAQRFAPPAQARPRPPVPAPPVPQPSTPPAVRLADGITSTKVDENPYNPDYGCKNRQNIGPTYPEGARRRGEAGDPKLRVHIDSSGQAFLVEILESSGYRALDEAARASMLTWKCLPSTLDGKRVPDMFDIRIHFSLE